MTERATLSDSYTEVQPVIASHVELPADSEAPDLNLAHVETSEEIMEWYDNLTKDVPIDQRKSLSAFFSHRASDNCVELHYITTELLPLINENINSF